MDSVGEGEGGKIWENGTPVLLPGKSHGWRSLVGCSPWGHEESDTTERLHFHLSLSCIGEGNGNPLQFSCLENPMDRAAWWATVHRVEKSRTRLSDFTSLHFMYSIRYKRISQTWRRVYMCVCTHTLSLCEIRIPNEFSVFYPWS